MIDSNGGVGNTISTQLSKVYKSVSDAIFRQTPKTSIIEISEFSSLVKETQTKALSEPNIRIDRLLEVTQELESNELPSGKDIADKMADGDIKNL